MLRASGFRIFVIFLAGIAAAGIFVVIFFDLLSDSGQKPPPKSVTTAARPEWMADPRFDPQAVAAAKKLEQQRALIVGVIGPLSGEEARYGQAVLTGITMAVDRFNNDGGFRGEAIKIISYDNNGGPDQAMNIATELIEKNVVAIFSAPTGWSTFAPIHLANQTQTVFISIGTRRKIGRSGGYIFRLSLPEEIAIDKMLGYASNDLGLTKFALVTSSAYDYSLDIASVFKQSVPRHGGEILIETDTYDTFTGKTDIAGVATALKAGPENLQAIIFTGGAGQAARLAGAISDLGLRIPIIGSEDLFNQEFLDQGGQAVRGSLLYTTFAPDRDTGMVNDFVNRHIARQKTAPGRFAALAFDAFNLLSRALEISPSLKGRAIRDALLKLKETEGVTGPSRWALNGAPIKFPHLYSVEGGPAGEKFVLVE